MLAQEGREPGVLNILGVGAIRLDQWNEAHLWDNASITLGSAISDGTEYEFFSNVAAKNNNDTNLSENLKLPEGHEFIIMKYGLYFPPDWLFANMLSVIENTYIWFETGNSKIRRRAPTWCWPIGLGISGVYAQDETASGPVTKHTCQLGVASRGAVSDLLIPVTIVNRVSFKAVLRFEVATTLTNSGTGEVWFVCDGFKKRPIM